MIQPDRNGPPTGASVYLTDREAAALIAPWWRKLTWSAANWSAHRRARAKVVLELRSVHPAHPNSDHIRAARRRYYSGSQPDDSA